MKHFLYTLLLTLVSSSIEATTSVDSMAMTDSYVQLSSIDSMAYTYLAQVIDADTTYTECDLSLATRNTSIYAYENPIRDVLKIN